MATIKSIAKQLGWEYQKQIMCGKVGNYLFTARQVVDFVNTANNCKLLYVPLMNITEEQAEKTFNYLKENKKELKVNSFEFSGHVLVIRLHEMLKAYNYESFTNLTNNLVNFFSQNEIATTPTCIHCNLGEVNAVMKIDKIGYHAHSECITKAQAVLIQSKEQFNNMDKKYGAGMVGALLGALIGMIPWLLLEIFYGFASLLSILIGIAAIYGYKKFGGVVTKLTKWIILAALLFAIIVSNIISLTVLFVQNDYAVILENYIIAYTDPEILGYLGLSIFFGLLGYIYVFFKVKGEEFNTKIE